MPDDVNPQPARRYDSSRRARQAELNRQSVLDAARRLFLAHGYAATKLADISADAGVSVETVYKAFANKAGLLKALFDVSVAGDAQPVPMAERDVIATIRAEPSARAKLQHYAEHLGATMPRSAPVQLLARDAAAADAGAASVWRQMRDETLEAMKMFADDLHATGQLAVPVNEARDVLWMYHAPELYELLVIERSWTAERYAQFLVNCLTNALIGPRSHA